MNNDEAVSINDISLDIIQKDDGDIKINDGNIESSWKDERINKLEEEIKNRNNLMSYFKGEVKTYVFANRKLKKSLVNTDKFLADLCGKIQIDHNKNNDTINNLKIEVEAKEALVKEMNKAIPAIDWSNINLVEQNKKELVELKTMISQKDQVISQQMVKIITKENEIETQNSRIITLEEKIYGYIDGDKVEMTKKQNEMSCKLQNLDLQIKQLQKHNHTLEEDITKLEMLNAEKKKNKFLNWVSKHFRSSSSADPNNNNNNNNNKSLRKTIKGFFTRKPSSSQQTQSLTTEDVNVQQTSQ